MGPEQILASLTLDANTVWMDLNLFRHSDVGGGGGITLLHGHRNRIEPSLYVRKSVMDCSHWYPLYSVFFWTVTYVLRPRENYSFSVNMLEQFPFILVPIVPFFINIYYMIKLSI